MSKYEDFKVGDQVVIAEGKSHGFEEFLGKVGVVKVVDEPGVSWPINVLFPGESLTCPLNPEELEHVV